MPGVVEFLLIIGELPCLQNIFLNSTDNFKNYLTTKTTTFIYKIPFLSSILTEKLLFGLIPRKKQYFSCTYNCCNKQVVGLSAS